MVVAQLVERLLLTPEIHSSNPVIGKFYLLSIEFRKLLVIERTKMKKEAQLIKNNAEPKKIYFKILKERQLLVQLPTASSGL